MPQMGPMFWFVYPWMMMAMVIFVGSMSVVSLIVSEGEKTGGEVKKYKEW